MRGFLGMILIGVAALSGCGGGGGSSGSPPPAEPMLSLLAGSLGGPGSVDGTGAVASFDTPTGVATDGAGNVYVADKRNNTMRKITPAGEVTTLAGTAGMSGSTDGTGAAARFFFLYPSGVATDSAGNVYVADSGNDTIRKITPAGAVTTLAGSAGAGGSTDGTGAAARFWTPTGVAVDGTGNVYVADWYNRTVSAGNVYVADTGNDTIRKITPAGVVTTIIGRPGEGGFLPGALPGLLNAPNSVALFGTTLYTTTNNAIVQVTDVP